jgi:hypothetical protein
MRSPFKSGMIFTLLITQIFTATNVWAKTALQIRSFQSTDYMVKESDSTVISWDIAGASKIQLISSKGAKYENLSSSGNLEVTTIDLTTFTLTAFGSSNAGTQVSQALSIIKQVAAPERIPPKPSHYLQPLYELGLQPIERSLLVGKNNNNYIADLQKKLHQVSDEGQIIWTIDLQGLIANQPVYLTNDNAEEFLFFAVSKSSLIDTNVAGQFCRLKINNKELSCINLKNNAIAGPAVYIENDITSSILSSSPRLFQIDVKGILHEFSPFDDEKLQLISRKQLLLNENEIRVLTTPQINSLTQQIIVRTEQDDLAVYPLPVAESFVSQSFIAMTKAFSNKASLDESTQASNSQTNQQPAQINPVWSRKFN